MPIGRLYCTGETVWASVPVFGRDFQATHLMLAVQVMTGLADELDDTPARRVRRQALLRRDRQGAGRSPARARQDVRRRTGMYL